MSDQKADQWREAKRKQRHANYANRPSWHCGHCGKEMHPTEYRRSAKWCSDYCRVTGNRAKAKKPKYNPETIRFEGGVTDSDERIKEMMDAVDAELATARANMSKTAQKQMARVLERYTELMYEKVREYLLEKLRKINAAHNEKLAKRERAVNDAQDRLNALLAKVDTLMTEQEYKMVRGCLHPDSNASPERKTKAFDIFSRLVRSVNWANPPREIRKDGWDKRSNLDPFSGLDPFSDLEPIT